jgi:hypothetical protein
MPINFLQGGLWAFVCMRKIKLTQNKYALVDNEDFEELSKYKWSAGKNWNKYYAFRQSSKNEGKRVIILMHRQILETPVGFHTDHKDGNGLNNQRKNLRIATASQNARNRGKPRTNKSGFKGVSWCNTNKKWYSRIKINQKSISLGYHTSKIEARKAYVTACKMYHKEFANPA